MTCNNSDNKDFSKYTKVQQKIIIENAKRLNIDYRCIYSNANNNK